MPKFHFTSRTKARKRAVDVLFEADQRGFGANSARLQELTEQRQTVSAAQTELPEYSLRILTGVANHIEEIDDLIQTYAKNWSIARMPGVDLAILRVGVWEMLYNADLDDAVAVEQATTLSAAISTDDSPRFINGLLGRIQSIKPTLAIEVPSVDTLSVDAQILPTSEDISLVVSEPLTEVPDANIAAVQTSIDPIEIESEPLVQDDVRAFDSLVADYDDMLSEEVSRDDLDIVDSDDAVSKTETSDQIAEEIDPEPTEFVEIVEASQVVDSEQVSEAAEISESIVADEEISETVLDSIPPEERIDAVWLNKLPWKTMNAAETEET